MLAARLRSLILGGPGWRQGAQSDDLVSLLPSRSTQAGHLVRSPGLAFHRAGRILPFLPRPSLRVSSLTRGHPFSLSSSRTLLAASALSFSSSFSFFLSSFPHFSFFFPSLALSFPSLSPLSIYLPSSATFSSFPHFILPSLSFTKC